MRSLARSGAYYANLRDCTPSKDAPLRLVSTAVVEDPGIALVVAFVRSIVGAPSITHIHGTRVPSRGAVHSIKNRRYIAISRRCNGLCLRRGSPTKPRVSRDRYGLGAADCSELAHDVRDVVANGLL
jgi:hypothetical protein